MIEFSEILPLVWYGVIYLSAILYVILDGFDLGVGILYFSAKKDEERRVLLNAIGPLWDGNEVWLIIVGGALFAGFPLAYGTLCSIYYDLIMLFLFGIILRVVAIEFRSKLTEVGWRKFWDVAFSLASTLISFGGAFLIGSMLQGVPFKKEGDYIVFLGSFMDFISPFSVCVGFLGVLIFALHGANFLLLKTEGELYLRVRRLIPWLIALYLGFYMVATLCVQEWAPHLFERYVDFPWLLFLPLLHIFLVYQNYRSWRERRDGKSFFYSCIQLALLFTLAAVGYFPKLLLSTIPEETLDPFNSASSDTTLKVILTIACLGLPFVFAYFIWLYRIFRGKVKLDETSY